MFKKITLFSLFALACTVDLMAQFQNATNGTVANTDVNTPMRRVGATGIGGFASPGSFQAPTSLLQVRAVNGNLFNQISQVETGIFGQFDPGNKWLGLGLGNPGASPSPYGLAIVDDTNLGFYNILAENNRKNLIAGFGVNGTTNDNRFIVRSYFGTNGTQGKDLLIASPNGSVGVNGEPLSSFFVDATQSTSAATFKAISIFGAQNLAGGGQTRTASAMGNQANASLATTGIAVEGVRAQIPDFVSVLQNLNGVATNLQAVRNPFGGFNQPDFLSQPPIGREYAELTWQDIDFPGVVSRDCNILPFATAQTLDKFFISFRNNQNVDPFSSNNKIPVMTFQGNGRVGIGTLQPTSGTCNVRDVLLDVNGWVVSSGQLTSSDKRFKKDIEPIRNSLDLVRQLEGKTYNFDQAAFPDRKFGSGRHYGFIAQELKEVLPEAAVLNSDGYYYVDYVMLVPVLTEAIKEQDKTITEQSAQIARLESELQEIRNMVMDIKSSTSTTAPKGFSLEQNAPNPFGSTTMVNYALPAGTTGASINVYDLNGRLLQTYKLSDLSGTVEIDGKNLGNGIYLYDLLVNGRQMDVKRMVLSKID